MIDFAGGAPVTGSLDVEWNHGTPGRRGDASRRSRSLLRRAHRHPAAEQVGQLRGAVPVPAVRQRPGLLLDTCGDLPIRSGSRCAVVGRPACRHVAGQDPREGYELVVAARPRAMAPSMSSRTRSASPAWRLVSVATRTRAWCRVTFGSARAGRTRGPGRWRPGAGRRWWRLSSAQARRYREVSVYDPGLPSGHRRTCPTSGRMSSQGSWSRLGRTEWCFAEVADARPAGPRV